ncbi:MAG: T9SS type A sorting domain-containing protein [Chitinophagaceae bacterium]|nr:T9SS type A sorting domain-containing protein [Chitinophagaceae bacterium]MCW5928684.1 T9SS type A sorting domain-containing protein [Chitinophagaceae bacterium]
MRKIYLRNGILSLICLLFFSVASGQNLIVNPSAEQAPTTNGWTATQTIGTACYTGGNWRIQGNQNGFPAAQQGTYIFFPGCGGTGSGAQYELYQNVNVSANASAIDAGNYIVNFSGYVRSYNQTPPDQTEMILEFRNASNTVIGFYSTTGTVAHVNNWVQYNHSQTAPAGTRTIRIRLIATSRNGDSVDGYFDNLSLTATVSLPVNLISYTAESTAQGSSLLKWETSDEINNRGFYIERSVNSTTWETIGFVAASVGGIIHRYQFTDPEPATGINYYRLKQVDLDGKYEYSAIRSLQYRYSGRTFVFPNPADNFLSIVTRDNKLNAQIINMNGKVMASFVNQKNIDIQHLPSGIYYLRLLYGNNRTETLRFLKR